MMSVLNGTSMPPSSVGTTSLPARPAEISEAESAEVSAGSLGQSQNAFRPVPGNASGLLQNFILPRTTLDALGLLKPSNQGDSEVLISQASLLSERLAAESDSAEATANGASASAQAAVLQEFRDRIAALVALNDAARETITENNSSIATLDADIAQRLDDLGGLQEQLQTLNQQIADLESIDPQTQAIRDQITQLTTQANDVRGQIDAANRIIADLQNARNDLVSENQRMGSEIAAREDTIAAQNQLSTLLIQILSALQTALARATESVKDAQVSGAVEFGELTLEEILPSMQELFEVDIEDAAVQELLDQTQIGDGELQKAVVLSYGLAGSFFEAMGIFLQLADLVELDLDTVARANNESQRMQIAV